MIKTKYKSPFTKMVRDFEKQLAPKTYMLPPQPPTSLAWTQNMLVLDEEIYYGLFINKLFIKSS